MYYTGSAVGHRSLQRYYRQKLKPERVRVSSALSRVMAQYRALGWTGTTGVCGQNCVNRGTELIVTTSTIPKQIR